MPKSTTIIAFDQHAATTVAAVLLSGQRTPALHTLTSAVLWLSLVLRGLATRLSNDYVSGLWFAADSPAGNRQRQRCETSEHESTSVSSSRGRIC